VRTAEVPLLLAGLSQFQFVEASDVAVQIWQGALDDDLPVEFALRWVAGYYGRPTAEKVAPVIPGNLNRAWRDEKASRKAVEQRRDDNGAAGCNRVPMPDYVREAYRRAARGTMLDDGAA